MKMKKMLAAVLAAAMVIGTTTAAFADTTLTGNSGSTDVSYTAQETYTVTIPANITLSATKLSDTGDVKVTDALLEGGHILTITVASANNYSLVKTFEEEDITSKIGYTLSGADNGKVLDVYYGEKSTKTYTQTLTFATTAENVADATLAGEHKDTLTFTVAIETISE